MIFKYLCVSSLIKKIFFDDFRVPQVGKFFILSQCFAYRPSVDDSQSTYSWCWNSQAMHSGEAFDVFPVLRDGASNRSKRGFARGVCALRWAQRCFKDCRLGGEKQGWILIGQNKRIGFGAWWEFSSILLNEYTHTSIIRNNRRCNLKKEKKKKKTTHLFIFIFL